LNSVFAQYEELSSPQFAVINLSLRLRLITANFGLDNSSYRAQPHSIIVNYCIIGHNRERKWTYSAQARARWFLALTLARNPQLASDRKPGGFQAPQPDQGGCVKLGDVNFGMD
jgi:hypothetical protein